MPNKNTFLIKPIDDLLKRLNVGNGWCDPFSNNNSPAEFTNDINPQTSAKEHLDAVDFLKKFRNGELTGVLLDPPYSLHQVTVSYGGHGLKRVIALTPVYDEISRILKNGGKCVSFGWGTNGIGRNRGFEIDEIYLIPHGGHHNDTLVTIETKIDQLF